MEDVGNRIHATRSRDLSVLRISVAAIVFFWVETFVVGFLEAHAGYSQIEHPISLLTIADPPLGLIHRVSFLILAAGMVGFTYLLAKQYPGNAWQNKLLVGLVLLHVFGRAAEGIFLWNPDAPGAAPSVLHQGLGMLGVVAMLPIPFLASRLARNSQARPSLSALSTGFGVVFLGLFAIGVILPVLPLGLGQRIGFILWYGWLVYFGAKSLALPRQSV